MNALQLRGAAYALSAHNRAQLPPDAGAEVAFAGRSNVGKSSAINAITGQNRLARASKTPGRTRQIIFFDVGDGRRLVDLPGYGYAKVALAARRHWEKFVADYLTRRCLRAVIIPMDIRRPLTDLDCAMLACCRQLELPAHILLTKSDKYKRGRATAALTTTRARLTEHGQQFTAQLFSATKKQGTDQAAQVISALLQ